VVTSGGQNLAATDTSAITVSEGASVSISLSRTDTTAITISEATSGSVTGTTTDTTAISVAESRTQAVSLSRTDTTAVSVSDVSAFGLNAVPASQTTAISVSETSSVNILVNIPGQESVAVSVAESSSIVIGGRIDIDTADTASLAVSETKTTSVQLAGNDTSALGLLEQNAFGLIPTSATDSVAITVSDVPEVLKDIATSDTLTIGAVESHVLDEHEGFTSKTATDSIVLNVAEQALRFDDSVDVSKIRFNMSTETISEFASNTENGIMINVDNDPNGSLRSSTERNKSFE